MFTLTRNFPFLFVNIFLLFKAQCSISEPLLVVRIPCGWVAFPPLFYFEKLNIYRKIEGMYTVYTLHLGSLITRCSLYLVLSLFLILIEPLRIKFTHHDTLSPNNYVCPENKDILLHNRDAIFIPKKLVYTVVP